ncbi:hypothetical protein [Lentzea aerocolonigenes]|uniref:hypothetical protein n=1 Tax=Lentzea aerocolonigenes TaxID=68170 RepID=UPI000B2C4E69|nr:hypothetical protein [Lentzea aerocolonigenes]MCP2248745.1 hypothetical protein [Lentzea aerocolonigenes]
MAAESRMKRRIKVIGLRVRFLIRKWRSGVLVTSGLGFLSAAAWTLHTVAGLAAVGISLLLVDLGTRGRS